MVISNKLLNLQMEVFLEWGKRHNTTSMNYREWIELFIQDTEKQDVLDITSKDVDQFVDKRYDVIKTKGTEIAARKALSSFLRFYIARSKNGTKRMRSGRPVESHEEINMVGELRTLTTKPPSFRAIARMLNADVRQIYRWYKAYNDKKAGE